MTKSKTNFGDVTCYINILTFCVIKSSYSTQTPATVIPCSLQSIAVAMEIIESDNDFQPVTIQKRKTILKYIQSEGEKKRQEKQKANKRFRFFPPSSILCIWGSNFFSLTPAYFILPRTFDHHHTNVIMYRKKKKVCVLSD